MRAVFLYLFVEHCMEIFILQQCCCFWMPSGHNMSNLQPSILTQTTFDHIMGKNMWQGTNQLHRPWLHVQQQTIQ
jgi:hypothetical protein